MNLDVSWFAKPERLKLGDVLICVIASSAFVVFGPDNAFTEMNINWKGGFLIAAIFFVGGFGSAYAAQRTSSIKIDAFYIRGWWCLISGGIALPVCYFFRWGAFGFSALLFGAGVAAIAGHLTYRICADGIR